ncbi:MAG: NAD(P)H-hydrate epimerase [Planctomycetota bacterium]
MNSRVVMSRDEVRRVDHWAIEEIGLAGVVLMENAGRQAADVACAMLEDAGASPRVAVLAGAGNNGGDGFVLARHLLLRGIGVDVYLLAPPETIRGGARANLDALAGLGVTCRRATGHPAATLTEQWGDYDLLVDALGGTGITGALRGDLAAAVEAANATKRPILAIDIPTGLDADTGRADGPAVHAERTITFVAAKTGFDTPGAAEFTGRVAVADIGVPPERR